MVEMYVGDGITNIYIFDLISVNRVILLILRRKT